MKIAVTGKNGQVVQSLLARADDGFEIVALGRPELDLAAPETIYPALAAVQPDLVISAAAYTAVDKAEDEPDFAFAINAIGAGAVSKAAAKLNIPIIHLSTDYVFDGKKQSPYLENDKPNPQSVYGHTKLQGEKLVALNNKKHIIIRTSWVYSSYSSNFLKTMLRLSGQRDEISVVCDQFGSPTSANDIADAIMHIIKDRYLNSDVWGVYHLSGGGEASWAEFARYIMLSSKKYSGRSCSITNILTSDYPTRAIRPKYSKLSNAKFQQTFHYRMNDWEKSVDIVVGSVLS